MLHAIKFLGTPILREQMPLVTSIGDKEVGMVNRMKFFLRKCDGYGLAANQIGYKARIFIYDIGDGPKTIVNPEITEFSDELWLYDEGCLSIPGFTFPIQRPKKVFLTGTDMDGAKVEIETDGLLARIFQHECDHLNGELIVDLLTEDKLESFTTRWHNKKKKKGRKQ